MRVNSSPARWWPSLPNRVSPHSPTNSLACCTPTIRTAISERDRTEDWKLKVYVIEGVTPAKARLLRRLLAKSIARDVDWQFSTPEDHRPAADITQLVAASIVIVLWMRDGERDRALTQLEWASRNGKVTIALVESGVAHLAGLNPGLSVEFDCRDPFPAVAKLDTMSDRVEVGLLPREAFKAVFADLAMVLLAFCLD